MTAAAIALWTSYNILRAHYTEDQRAMFAARLANMPQGARTDLGPIGLMSQPEAAAQLNVSIRGIQRAAVVQRDAEPEVVAAVRSGRLPAGRRIEDA